jgi:hypothetical protein
VFMTLFKLLQMENTRFPLSINRWGWCVNIHWGERPSDRRYMKENGEKDTREAFMGEWRRTKKAHHKVTHRSWNISRQWQFKFLLHFINWQVNFILELVEVRGGILLAHCFPNPPPNNLFSQKFLRQIRTVGWFLSRASNRRREY